VATTDGMDCDQVREVLSARLDGESAARADGASAVIVAAAADAHLDGCDACRGWHDEAARVTRLARIALARPDDAGEGLDLAAILAAAPGRRWAITGRVLRVALAALGFAQFVLGVAQIAAMGAAGQFGSADGMSSGHLLHESAAWNVAIGAGYLWIAFRRARPAAILPVLTAFVAVLAVLSLADLISGEVVLASLLTHAFVAAGYVVLLLLRLPRFDAVTPPGRPRWRLRPLDTEIDVPEPMRVRRAERPSRDATASTDRHRAA